MVASKTKKAFTKEDTWLDISARFCRFHGLPFGSSLKIIYTSSKYTKPRVQRSNTVYQRAVFRKDSIDRAMDDENIRTLIDRRLLPYININLRELGAEIFAFGPDGLQLDARTHIRTWRAMPPLPTEDEIEAESNRDREIEEIAGDTGRILNNLAEFRFDPEDTVPQGVIRALVRKYGSFIVRKAVGDETKD